MFTYTEQKVILFLCLLLLSGAVIKAVNLNREEPTKEEVVLEVNINTANIGQLIEIKGIGLKTAERIIDYRQNNGPFESLDDLKKIKGIGDKKLSMIREYIIIN